MKRTNLASASVILLSLALFVSACSIGTQPAPAAQAKSSDRVSKKALMERTENLTSGKITVSTPNADGSYTVSYDSTSAQAKELLEFAEAVERGEKSIEDAPEITR